MTVGTILARARRRFQVLMRDECTITRVTGQTFDPDTGTYTDTTETVYTGPCRLKPEFGGFETEAGSREVGIHRHTVMLPWDTTTAVRKNDIVTLTASDDLWIVDKPLAVTSIRHGSDRAKRSVIVEDRSDSAG